MRVSSSSTQHQPVAQDENLRRITVSNDDGDVYVESSGDGSEIVLKTEKVRVDGDVYTQGDLTNGLTSKLNALSAAQPVSCFLRGTEKLEYAGDRWRCACSSGWTGDECGKTYLPSMSTSYLGGTSTTARFRLAVKECLQKSPSGSCACTNESPCGYVTDGSNMTDWDASGVTDMSYLFANAENFNQDVGRWDVSSVTDMRSMFSQASSFNQRLNSWDVSSVTDMSFMFRRASQFNQDIKDWNVSRVKDMSYMFHSAENFNRNVGAWRTSAVTDMKYMFKDVYSFNQNLGAWDVSSVTDMSHMFENAHNFNADITGWVSDNVLDASYMFQYATSFQNRFKHCLNYGSDGPPSACVRFSFQTDYSLVLAIQACFAESAIGDCSCHSGCGEAHGHISTWNTTGITRMQNLFRNRRTFNQDLSAWDVRAVERMDGMFEGAASFNGNLRAWNVANVVDMSNMFARASSFARDISSWNTKSDVVATDMFADAYTHNILYDCAGGVDGPPLKCAERGMPESLEHRFDFSNASFVETGSSDGDILTAVSDIEGNVASVGVFGSPVYARGAQNGLNVANFTADGAYVEFESGSSLSTEPEIFLVFQASRRGVTGDATGELFNLHGFDGSYSLFHTSSSRVEIASAAGDTLASSYAGDAKWYVANFRVETDGEDGFLRLNGGSIDHGAFSSSLTGTNRAATAIRFGGSSTSGLFVQNAIGEMLVFNEKLSELDRAYVDAYLANKWDATGGTSWAYASKITASDGNRYDYFGRAVAASEDTLVVGTPYDDGNDSNEGSAYVFTRVASSSGSWEQTKKLTPRDGDAAQWGHYYANFGTSVAVSGDTIVVGKPRGDYGGMYSDSIQAYVYRRDDSSSDWEFSTLLEASDGSYTNDYFGQSVAVSGGVICVGAPYNDDRGSNSGSAYVFELTGTNWTETAKLVPSDLNRDDQFGYSVAVFGEIIVVGAPYGDDDRGQNAGSAYVFGKIGTTWTQLTKLEPSERNSYDNFGRAVAIWGDTIAVGAPYDDEPSASNGANLYDTGSVYIFDKSSSSASTYNWTLTDKIVATKAGNYLNFGVSVAVSENFVIVGGNGEDSMYYGNNLEEYVYVYMRTNAGWVEHQNLTAIDGQNYDQFGTSVAVSESTLVVGAVGDDDRGSSSGSAYVFTLQ